MNIRWNKNFFYGEVRDVVEGVLFDGLRSGVSRTLKGRICGGVDDIFYRT